MASFFIPICHAKYDCVSYGVVNHPSELKRSPYFSALYLEHGYCVEISRSESQFIDFLAVEDVIATGDETIVSPAVENLVNELSTTEINDIRSAAEQTSILGDVLLSLDSYKNEVPAKFSTENGMQYSGIFPSSYASSICKFEFNYYKFSNQKLNFIETPCWLDDDISHANLERMIDQYILDNNYIGAWFSISRPGVSVQYAKSVIEQLSSKMSIQQALAWILAADADDGNY